MKWMNVNDALPETTGAYIVSLKMKGTSGARVFEDVAWFYAPGKKWLKYDPFEDNKFKMYKGEITPLVVGWMADVISFVG